jgi:hypothetical protein
MMYRTATQCTRAHFFALIAADRHGWLAVLRGVQVVGRGGLASRHDVRGRAAAVQQHAAPEASA